MSAFTHGVKVVFAVGLFASALVACDDGTTGTGGSSSSTTGTKGTTTTTSKSSSGAQMTTGSGGGGPVCGLTIDDRPDCQACVDGSCCAEQQDCDPTGTTDCGVLTKCIIACGMDAACQQACVDTDETATMGAGLTAFRLIFDCFDQNCAADPACVYPICDSGLVLQDEACATCLTDSCCTPVKACADDPACLACVTDPMQKPGMPCGTAGGPVDMLFQAQEMCQSVTCKADCTFSICGSDLGYSASSCNACLSDNCCTSFNACLADMTCTACLSAPDGAGCATNQLFTAFTTCRDTAGAMTCGDAGECN